MTDELTSDDSMEGELDEAYHEGLSEGYGAGFDRCCEILAAAAARIGLSQQQIAALQDGLRNWNAAVMTDGAADTLGH